MTYVAALLALGCSYADARPIIRPLKAAAKQHRIDPLLLVAVVAHESRCRNDLVSRNRNGSCDVGAFQINVPGCQIQRVRRFLVRSEGAAQGAKILAMGRARCVSNWDWYCRRGMWWARYNGKSKAWANSIRWKWRLLRSRFRLPVL